MGKGGAMDGGVAVVARVAMVIFKKVPQGLAFLEGD